MMSGTKPGAGAFVTEGGRRAYRSLDTTTRRALFVAVVYVGLGAVYILVSSGLAASFANDVSDLARLEQVEGLIFVGVSASVVFVTAFLMMDRTERAAQTLDRQRTAIMASERRALSGMTAAAIAHDANNVLASLSVELELMAVHDEPQAAALAAAREGIDRLVELNRRLLGAARNASSGGLRELDVLETAKDAMTTLRFHESLRAVHVTIDGAPGSRIRANPVLVHQIISNLVLNAGEATRAKGHVAIRVARVTGTERGKVILEVHDDGPGIPEERRTGLFSALETTKPEGTGLGLYSARASASMLGGHIEIDASPLGGACFRVMLPRV